MRVLKRAPRCGCERTMVTCPSLGPGPFPRVRVPLCSQLFPGTQLPGSPPPSPTPFVEGTWLGLCPRC